MSIFFGENGFSQLSLLMDEYDKIFILTDERINKLIDMLEDKDFKYGNIIAKCKLVDCIYMDEDFVKNIKQNNPIEYQCGEYSVGRYAWVLEDIEKLENPISVKGHLGIWNYEG